jgi:hypothetical protein
MACHESNGSDNGNGDTNYNNKTHHESPQLPPARPFPEAERKKGRGRMEINLPLVTAEFQNGLVRKGVDGRC